MCIKHQTKHQWESACFGIGDENTTKRGSMNQRPHQISSYHSHFTRALGPDLLFQFNLKETMGEVTMDHTIETAGSVGVSLGFDWAIRAWRAFIAHRYPISTTSS